MYRLLAVEISRPRTSADLGIGQLFEMPQGDDLAVDRLHAVKRGLDLNLNLGPRNCLAGGRVTGPAAGPPVRPSWPAASPLVQRDFAAGIPHGRAQVLAMNPHQPLSGHQPQPEEKRHLTLGQVVRQLLGDIEIRLLEHVGSVDSPLQPAVEPQPNHLPQPFAIAAEEFRKGGLGRPRPAQVISRSSSSRA